MSELKLPVISKSKRQWTKAEVLAQVAKRQCFTEEDASKGAFRRMVIQGDGVVLDVRRKGADGKPGEQVASRDGVALTKKLLNVDANSDIRMRSAEAKTLFNRGAKFEAAGKLQEASDYFNAFLNYIQIDVAVIIQDSKIAHLLGNRTQISGNLELRENVISIDPKSIKVLEAERGAATVFAGYGDDEDLFEDEEDNTEDPTKVSEDELLNTKM